MTARLRGWIKDRDNHTCKQCGISVAAEPHLLLEVDHIIPVSRGGLSEPDNLQTLCWRCNRTKGSKMPEPKPEPSGTLSPGTVAADKGPKQPAASSQDPDGQGER